MSLLDDVSIVVTPNGYKAGELYAVIPVPTEGTELLTNEDFTNGDTGWSNGGTTSFSNSQVTITGVSYIVQSNLLTIGKNYKLTINVDSINTNSGTVIVALGSGSDPAKQSLDQAGNLTFYFYDITFGSNWIQIFTTSDATVTVNSISVKEYTSADMDVTRATAATRVDEDGLVNYAEIIGDEEVTNGDFATDSDWTLGGLATISGGNANFIDGGSNTYSYIRQNISQTSTKQYLLQFEIKNYVSGAIQVFLQGGSSIGTYNSNGVYSVVLLSGTTNGYIEISRSYSGGTYSFSIDNVSVKEVTRDNVPRIDYTGGGCPHILAEPQRTNTLSYSEDFEASGWGVYNSTLETDAVISPNGILNATKLIGTNDVTAHTLYTNAYTVVASVDYTHSVFIKKSQSKYVQLYTGSGFGNYYANFNLEDGIVETFTTLDANIENIGDGWYKCSTKANSSTTTAQSTVALIDSATSGRGYAFNAEDESVYMWGAQIEQGSYATSYIPTSGSTVTRNQDIFTRDGIGSLINSTEGVLFVEMAALANDGIDRYITLSDGGIRINSIRIYYFHTGGFIFFQKYVGGTRTTNMSTTSYTQTSFNKLAIRYNSTTVDVWANGVKILTNADTNAITSGTLNSLKFSQGDGTNPFFGKVKQLQVYDTSLSDTQLAALTS